MNRNITLILSAVVVVILLVVWLYLMFFATPKEPGPVEGSGAYSEFGELGEDAPGGTGTNLNGEDGQVARNNDYNPETGAYEPDILRQLTTRNVIGYGEVEIASTTHVVYMESGVGHIYSINLETGVEERVSATTIPDARVADFSSDGSVVAVKTGNSSGVQPLSLATVDFVNKSVVLEQLEERVSQFSFTEDDVLLYALVNNSSVDAKSYALDDASSRVIFSVPFREAVIDFGSTEAGRHYFWPKDGYTLEGFVYEFDNGSLRRLPIDGFGLSANGFDGLVLATHRNSSYLVSTYYNTSLEEPQKLASALIPSKCVGGADVLYCAVPKNNGLRHDDIKRWNQGTVSFVDKLAQINLESGGVEDLIDASGYSSRNIDVKNGALGSLTDDWYFQNKIDDSLWIYELSRLEEEVLDNTNAL